MNTHLDLSDDALPLLDEEFDRGALDEELADNSLFDQSLTNVELAWDDQLDSGHEMTL